MDETEKNVILWQNTFDKYLETEIKCNNLINQILDIKNNLKKMVGNQKKDDLTFYKYLIESSVFYLTNSLKVRKIKFIKDLNYIWSLLDGKKTMDELNRADFQTLMKDYRKKVDEINYAKKNNTTLQWVKDDVVISLVETEKDMNDTMEYHYKLIQFFYSSIELEKIFYCGK
jgi:hypothetical protein